MDIWLISFVMRLTAAKKSHYRSSWVLKRGAGMGVTITLKNIPEDTYLGLKSAAKVHRRSLNSEVIACLELVLTPARTTNDAHLAAAQQIRDELKGKSFRVVDIAKAIDQGRL